MKPKQILFIVIAFAVLGVLYIVQQRGRTPVTQGLGYEEVLGEPLATSDVRGFKCYLSGKEEEAVHLVREDEGWVVRSKFNASAQESKVKELLDQLAGLKGELRSSSDEVLEDYGIADDSAVYRRIIVSIQPCVKNSVASRLTGIEVIVGLKIIDDHIINVRQSPNASCRPVFGKHFQIVIVHFAVIRQVRAAAPEKRSIAFQPVFGKDGKIQKIHSRVAIKVS